MYNKILKLAKLYEQHLKLTKRASIASDLALRIMHSLVPKATEHPMEAQFAQTHLTQKHLIDVAERYMERAAKIIKEEMVHSPNPSAYKRINIAFNAKNYLAVARIGAQEFSNDNWEDLFGGQRWKQFSEQLANLGFAIKKFKNSNKKEKSEAAGMISVYMNVLDGLTHNTGSFLDKMIANESQEEAEDTEKSSEKIYHDKKNEVLTMMDVKQLDNSDNVLPFIKQYMYGNPDSYLYREYFSKLMNNSKPDIEQTKKQLGEIRNKKQLINYLDRSLDNMIYNMQSDIRSKDLSRIKNYYDYLNTIIKSSKWRKAASVIDPIIKKYNLQEQFSNIYGQDNVLNRMLQKPNVIIRLLSNYMVQQNRNGDFLIEYEGNYYIAKCKDKNCVIENTDLISASQLGLVKEYITKDNLVYMLSGESEDKQYKTEQFLISIINCAKEIRQAIVNFFDLGLASIAA